MVQKVHNEIRIRVSEPIDNAVLAAEMGLTPHDLSLILKLYTKRDAQYGKEVSTVLPYLTTNDSAQNQKIAQGIGKQAELYLG